MDREADYALVTADQENVIVVMKERLTDLETVFGHLPPLWTIRGEKVTSRWGLNG